MSELGWRFFVWMSKPSKLKGLAWRFFFWITPRWLSRKWQVYMLGRFVERYPAEVDHKLREVARDIALKSGRREWEGELFEWQKNCLDYMLNPRSDRFDKFGRILRPRSDK
jgi:hypothetical protein